jgi:hypothetical protein
MVESSPAETESTSRKINPHCLWHEKKEKKYGKAIKVAWAKKGQEWELVGAGRVERRETG